MGAHDLVMDLKNILDPAGNRLRIETAFTNPNNGSTVLKVSINTHDTENLLLSSKTTGEKDLNITYNNNNQRDKETVGHDDDGVSYIVFDKDGFLIGMNDIFHHAIAISRFDDAGRPVYHKDFRKQSHTETKYKDATDFTEEEKQYQDGKLVADTTFSDFTASGIPRNQVTVYNGDHDTRDNLSTNFTEFDSPQQHDIKGIRHANGGASQQSTASMSYDANGNINAIVGADNVGLDSNEAKPATTIADNTTSGFMTSTIKISTPASSNKPATKAQITTVLSTVNEQAMATYTTQLGDDMNHLPEVKTTNNVPYTETSTGGMAFNLASGLNQHSSFFKRGQGGKEIHDGRHLPSVEQKGNKCELLHASDRIKAQYPGGTFDTLVAAAEHYCKKWIKRLINRLMLVGIAC